MRAPVAIDPGHPRIHSTLSGGVVLYIVRGRAGDLHKAASRVIAPGVARS